MASVLYSLFLMGPFTSIVLTTRGHVDLMERAIATSPDSIAFFGPSETLAMLPLAFVPPVIGWLASLVYMHGVVRRKPAPANV